MRHQWAEGPFSIELSAHQGQIVFKGEIFGKGWGAHPLLGLEGSLGAEILRLAARVRELEAQADAEMERVKACEHIAEEEDGWEVLRNLCPSTAAVASQADRISTLEEENRRLRKTVEGLTTMEREQAR